MGYVDSWTQRYRGTDLGPHSLLLARLLVRRRAMHIGAGIVLVTLVARTVLYLVGATSLSWSIMLTALVALAAWTGMFVQRLGDGQVARTIVEPARRLEPVLVGEVVSRGTVTLLTCSYVGGALLGVAALPRAEDRETAVVFLVGVALLGAVTASALRSAVNRPVIAVDHGSLQADDLLRVDDARHAAVAYPVLLALVTMTSSGWLLTVYTVTVVVIAVVAMAHETLTPKVPVTR